MNKKFIKTLSCFVVIGICATLISAKPVSATSDVKQDFGKVKVKYLGKEIKSKLVDKVDEKSEDNIITVIDKNDLKKDKKSYKSSKDIVKEDLDNNKYVVVYGEDIEDTSVEELAELMDLPKMTVEPIDNDAKQLEKEMKAYGISKNCNNGLVIDSYYVIDDEKKWSIETNMDNIIEMAVESLHGKDKTIGNFMENDTAKVQTVGNNASDYTYSKTVQYTPYGNLQVTTYIDRISSSANYNGSIVSLWDVKQSNTTKAGYSLYSSSWWKTSYLYTRLSSPPNSTERVIDHGPGSTERDTTASVGLDSSGPSVSWSYSTKDVTVVDDYTPPTYGRWIHDFKLDSTAAKNTYTASPGIRITNAKGNFVVDVSNTVTFNHHRMPWENIDQATGVWRYAVGDR